MAQLLPPTVSITSTPANGTHYVTGEAITTRIVVTLNIQGGSVQNAEMKLDIGGVERRASSTSTFSSGMTTVNFSYTVVADDSDTDGIGIPANAIDTMGSSWTGVLNFMVTNVGLNNAALSDQIAHQVITPPIVSSVAVASPAAASTFERGENIDVAVTFNEAVVVSGAPQVEINIGTESRQAVHYSFGTDASILRFSYTVVQADADTNGISIGASALTLNGGTIRAVADQLDAVLGLGSNAFTDDSTRLVDGTQFTAATVATTTPLEVIAAPVQGNTYGLGERIGIWVWFTRPVTVTGMPRLPFTIGSTLRYAEYDGNPLPQEHLTFEYIVQGANSGGNGPDGVDLDSDGFSVAANALTLNGGTITDARDATVNVNLAHGALAANANRQVNGGPAYMGTPAVTDVRVLSEPRSGGTYGTGDEIRVRVSFNRAVRVMGTPQLALAIGDATRQATYVSGTGTLNLVFSYAVQVGDTDADGISTVAEAPSATPPTLALTLNGGAIEIYGEIAGETPGSRPVAALALGTNTLENEGGHAVLGVLPPVEPEGQVATGDGQPPVVIGDSELAVVIEAGESAELDADGMFRDPEGEELTYSTTSSNEEVVWPSIERGTLLLGAGRSGVANVVLGATDPQGLSAAVDVQVYVWEPACDEMPQADGTAAVIWRRAPPRYGVVEAQVPEGDTAMVVAALREPASTATKVRWWTGTDSDPATPNADANDYDASAFGEVEIKPGQRCVEIEIGTTDDAEPEASREWFSVALELNRPGAGQLVRQRIPVAILEGVCDRTPTVRQGLVDATGAESCEQPGPMELASVRTLSLEGQGLGSLAPGDFGELSNLRTLAMSDNALTQISPDVLAPLERLRDLLLADNALTELLPNAFAGLPQLRVLRLDGNELQQLPDGAFAGLSRLRLLRLDGNPGAPFPLAIELERTNAEPWAPPPAQVRAVVPAGAPFDLPMTLSVQGGTLAGGASTTATAVLAGETAGAAVLVSSENGFARATLSQLPEFPARLCMGEPCWRGFELALGQPLGLFARPPRALTPPAPEPLFGESLQLTLSALAVPGQPDGALSWSASSSDPAVATVEIADGQLLVAPAPGAEGTVIVEATATDANGQTATVRFAVVVEFHWPSGASKGWRGALMPN